MEDDITKDPKFDISRIINEITSSVHDDKDCAYLLDVILLDKDKEKLNCDNSESKPTISMAIYNYITNVLGKKCFLYLTDHYYCDRVAKNWIDLYNKIYFENKFENMYENRITNIYYETTFYNKLLEYYFDSRKKEQDNVKVLKPNNNFNKL